MNFNPEGIDAGHEIMENYIRLKEFITISNLTFYRKWILRHQLSKAMKKFFKLYPSTNSYGDLFEIFLQVSHEILLATSNDFSHPLVGLLQDTKDNFDEPEELYNLVFNFLDEDD